MHDINLLNGFYKQGRTARIIGTASALIVIVSLLSYIALIVPLSEKKRLTLEAVKFTQLNLEYESAEKEHGSLSRQIEELREKADNLNRIATAIEWSEVFSFIERVIPREAALSSLSYREGILTIQGWAENDIEVARFILGLKRSGMFTEVKLKRIDRDGSGESFIMLCSF